MTERRSVQWKLMIYNLLFDVLGRPLISKMESSWCTSWLGAVSTHLAVGIEVIPPRCGPCAPTFVTGTAISVRIIPTACLASAAATSYGKRQKWVVELLTTWEQLGSK